MHSTSYRNTNILNHILFAIFRNCTRFFAYFQWKFRYFFVNVLDFLYICSKNFINVNTNRTFYMKLNIVHCIHHNHVNRLQNENHESKWKVKHNRFRFYILFTSHNEKYCCFYEWYTFIICLV